MNIDRFHPVALATRLHRDERGVLSAMGVITIFMLTLLLGMIFNMGKQIDEKLRMQNAADAATYSSTRTLTRGMNAIAYSNHLLCEVFAITAYMRIINDDIEEGQPLESTQAAREALLKWQEVAEVLEREGRAANIIKFEALGAALQRKIPLEEEVVTRYDEFIRAHSWQSLEVFEYILRGDGVVDYYASGKDPYVGIPPQGGLITEFQRSVMMNTPMLAQSVAEEVVRRHTEGQAEKHFGFEPTVYLFRARDGLTMQEAQSFETLARDRTLPVIDPTPANPYYQDIAVNVQCVFVDSQGTPTNSGGPAPVANVFDPQQPADPAALPPDQLVLKYSYDTRTALAKRYLDELIFHWVDVYARERTSNRTTPGFFGRDRASLSQLSNFWRIFNCPELNRMLHEEFACSNLPFILRGEVEDWHVDPNREGQPLSSFYNNVYYQPPPYARAMREDYQFVGAIGWVPIRQFAHKVFDNPFRDQMTMTYAESKMFLPRRMLRYPWYDESNADYFGQQNIYANGNNWPSSHRSWSLMTQNWRTKMVPATSDQLVDILNSQVWNGGPVAPPNLTGFSASNIRQISPH